MGKCGILGKYREFELENTGNLNGKWKNAGNYERKKESMMNLDRKVGKWKNTVNLNWNI